ncbi:unnamed protein product [Orchesella dallaii]|uniref:Gustatory receptor n=1 Tax=Orchesella dallaii TaxID=48710 RepID=A0ABP1QDD7_9HEXA
MFRTSQTENVVLKSLRTKIVHMDAQLADYNKQGKPAVSTRKLEIFHWYFLAAYYAIIIPFKIKNREGGQAWKTKSWKFQKRFLTAYMLFLFVLCIVYYVHEGEFYDNFLYKTITNGRKRFFLGNLQSNISQMHVNGTHDMYGMLYTNENILVGFADLALWLSRQWYLVFVTTFFYGVLPVTFWSVSKLFQRYLSGIDNFHTESPTPNESFNISQADMVVEKYEELRNLVASLNSVWSTGTLLFVICESLDLIVNLNPKVESKDMAHICLYVMFLLFFMVLLVMYAEGCRMNASIKLWLSKKYTREQLFAQRKNELECLERYFEVTPIGIGAIGVYEISYGFLGQLLVFCVTAFLITF